MFLSDFEKDYLDILEVAVVLIQVLVGVKTHRISKQKTQSIGMD